MSFSTGKNYDNTRILLINSPDAELISKTVSMYKKKDLPVNITDKLTKCDIPHVENNKSEFMVYFSCCSDNADVLAMSVLTAYPDVIEKQIYDLLMPVKQIA
jgi:hypothetical protein